MDQNIETVLLALGMLALGLVGWLGFLLYQAWENKMLADRHEWEHSGGS
jgi:hypothetical protein